MQGTMKERTTRGVSSARSMSLRRPCILIEHPTRIADHGTSQSVRDLNPNRCRPEARLRSDATCVRIDGLTNTIMTQDLELQPKRGSLPVRDTDGVGGGFALLTAFPL